MTRRRKDPFAEKENVRHFRLVHRPLGSEMIQDEKDTSKILSFDDLFEEYDPSGSRHFRGQEILETEEVYEEDGDEGDSYDFANDDDGEMVDIDAELDQFTEEFIDIEGEDGLDRVKTAVSEEKVGEAAKYGILLDDRDYDYTKHLRKVGITPGAVFIQAPGMKKINNETEKKPRDFFATEEVVEAVEEEVVDVEPSAEVLKENHEIARQQYRALLQQVSDDPMLREVIEALEDDRYVTGEVDDELVISLDNMNINQNDDGDYDFFDEDVDILEEDQEFPDFIPSEALKRQMEKIAAQEAKYAAEQEERDELDDILDEYEEQDDDNEYYENENNFKRSMMRNDEFIDIEEESEIDPVAEAEAAKIYKYLREHGRARGTTLYDKKRPGHLPPIHVAIAQYNELRRELAVNNDLIIQKYSQEDEEETKRQIRESEKFIEGMVKIIDDPIEMEKRLNIETAKYLLKLGESVGVTGPKKIVETNKGPRKPVASQESEADADDINESDSETESEEEKVNKGVARSADETAEEKKARKARIKAEKREKRATKAEKKNRK